MPPGKRWRIRQNKATRERGGEQWFHLWRRRARRRPTTPPRESFNAVPGQSRCPRFPFAKKCQESVQEPSVSRQKSAENSTKSRRKFTNLMTEPWRAWSASHSHHAAPSAARRWIRASIAALAHLCQTTLTFVEYSAPVGATPKRRIGSATDKPNGDTGGKQRHSRRRCKPRRNAARRPDTQTKTCFRLDGNSSWSWQCRTVAAGRRQ